ncbi:MAG: type II toxin-antitoxin system YoeB family toxin [Nanoarchaeota archaeon]|nr:type II toxin-antitoxin system YoeB family toxin [Nanoarchaeota archaeon]
MKMKSIYVGFIDKKLKKEFEDLKSKKFQDQELYKFIDGAMDDMKKNPSCGIKIPKKLWPRVYIQKYKITNLWKYDLPNGWRLIYTINTDEIKILSIILEWLNHKEYERKFKY